MTAPLRYWTCPRCKIMWPLNAHGFAVTCNCDDGTADATKLPNRLPETTPVIVIPRLR